ncbi:uncharacterized protein AMSG_02818 [Thecamonas trahens ATCC 50062]|uniref:Uncharacterized protein n=1 Tax=Thecamonas trahens ATCC 50062 TaxID=461836 RepID=A0A0L0D2E5_THETB|nr:hypothetical protein AMSG_02818 [Thecamonas trahens ATCC 50062]KNC46366.1 hypothetical protein AMSG_02818 [Thecamonas trahens ATCC 50062]|eukprot:XP_013760659.1 hypothetical protein AMSG_02818 [Thecamonas trahens ATCC 50062]
MLCLWSSSRLLGVACRGVSTVGSQVVWRTLAHRPPFLLVDAVEEHEIGVALRGVKHVVASDVEDGAGAGVLSAAKTLEGAGQSACILVKHIDGLEDSLPVFAGFQNIVYHPNGKLPPLGSTVVYDIVLETIKGARFGLVSATVTDAADPATVYLSGQLQFGFLRT